MTAMKPAVNSEAPKNPHLSGEELLELLKMLRLQRELAQMQRKLAKVLKLQRKLAEVLKLVELRRKLAEVLKLVSPCDRNLQALEAEGGGDGAKV